MGFFLKFGPKSHKYWKIIIVLSKRMSHSEFLMLVLKFAKKEKADHKVTNEPTWWLSFFFFSLFSVSSCNFSKCQKQDTYWTRLLGPYVLTRRSRNKDWVTCKEVQPQRSKNQDHRGYTLSMITNFSLENCSSQLSLMHNHIEHIQFRNHHNF